MALTKVRAAGFGTGSILQVKNYVKQGNQTLTYNTFSAVTDLQTGDLTPISASSKFLIFGTVMFGGADTDWAVALQLFHRADSGTLAEVTGISSTHKTGSNDLNAIGGQMWDGTTYQQFVQAPITFSFLHTPSYTSTVKYELHASQLRTGKTAYVNRMGNTSDSDYNAGSTSQMTVMEIAG